MSQPPPTGSDLDRIRTVLGRARELGFVGPGEIEPQWRHAHAFADAVTTAARETALELRQIADLGSGAGLPGLVMAVRLATVRFVLVEASERRAQFLSAATRELGLEGRVAVAAERAEQFGRADAHRERYDAVVARGFGRPAVTAECAAPLLRVGGILVVSAPPSDVTGGISVGCEGAEGTPAEAARRRTDGRGGGARWPSEGLAALHMVPIGEVRVQFGFDVVRQSAPCPARYPRRVGVPAKRPLF